MGDRTFRSSGVSRDLLGDSDNYKHFAATRLSAHKNLIPSHLVSSFDTAATLRTPLATPSSCDARQSSIRLSLTIAPRVHPGNPTPLHNPSHTVDRKI